MDNRLTSPAAQYLRASTDHQQYSLDNQEDGIARYANEHGFSVVKTYADAAKSGLALKNRSGLKQLLKDVVEGNLAFQAILVYDVSRWGRFQDADESAHYEYLCKSSGVPVHYCAETFPNDNSMPGHIMKALKRSMAGEYSRELSGKVWAGLARLTKMGYKSGGNPIYGLRRMLLDTSGRPKQLLSAGQRKSLATERVVLVPGPPDEVLTVKRIFHEFASEYRSLRSIARRLNADGIPYLKGVKWDADDIRRLLKQPTYAGKLVWGRTKCFLGSKARAVPYKDWVVRDNAFEPLIGSELFEKAQANFANLTRNLTDDEMIERIRRVWRAEGRLTSGIIERSLNCPSLTTLHSRFGGLLSLYKKVGYPEPDFASIEVARQQGRLIRQDLIDSFVRYSGGQLEIVRPSGKFRALLRYRKTRRLISILLARYRPTLKGETRWIVIPHIKEHHRVTVLVLLNKTNTGIEEMRVFARLGRRRFAVRPNSDVLAKAVVVEQASELVEAVNNMRLRDATLRLPGGAAVVLTLHRS